MFVDGQIAGEWQRTIGPDRVDVQMILGRPLNAGERAAVEAGIASYGRFHGRAANIDYSMADLGWGRGLRSRPSIVLGQAPPAAATAARIPDARAIAALTAAVTCRPWNEGLARRFEHRKPQRLGKVLRDGDGRSQCLAQRPARFGGKIGGERSSRPLR